MVENKNLINVLSIICIVLAASLVAVVAINMHNKSSLSGSGLQATDLQKQIDVLKDKVAVYEERIENLTNENNNQASILAIKEYAVLVGDMSYDQDANANTTLFDGKLSYAGYVEVKVESTSDTTYIQTSYKFNNFVFDQKTIVGTSGTAYFAVLPGPVEIVLGNTNTEAIEATVTLTVFY
jgi:cell division protein FtsB